jgi:SNF2 family DNA or RNA helicase
VRSAFFTGEEGQKRRTQNIVDFHDDPACRVLFATDAGGVGLNLQRAANACINLELPWNPAVLEQRIGRIHRLGQKRPIDVYNLVSEWGIEPRISDLVGNKRAFFTGLFDGTTDEVAFERSGAQLLHAAAGKQDPA